MSLQPSVESKRYDKPAIQQHFNLQAIDLFKSAVLVLSEELDNNVLLDSKGSELFKSTATYLRITWLKVTGVNRDHLFSELYKENHAISASVLRTLRLVERQLAGPADVGSIAELQVEDDAKGSLAIRQYKARKLLDIVANSLAALRLCDPSDLQEPRNSLIEQFTSPNLSVLIRRLEMAANMMAVVRDVRSHESAARGEPAGENSFELIPQTRVIAVNELLTALPQIPFSQRQDRAGLIENGGAYSSLLSLYLEATVAIVQVSDPLIRQNIKSLLVNLFDAHERFYPVLDLNRLLVEKLRERMEQSSHWQGIAEGYSYPSGNQAQVVTFESLLGVTPKTQVENSAYIP